ncbi:MAG TPA: helix-turn-helix domain-containing protein [Microvirga sp.]|jgi:DNA-binding HxlR family transcriptional regulator
MKTGADLPEDVSAKDEPHAECRALAQVLDRIGDKWTIMAVGALSHGPMRFNALMRRIGGVSHRMLTLTLRGLERDGLVRRTAYPTIPPRVDYELTPLGHSLIGPLAALSLWGRENRTEIERSRRAFDRRESMPEEQAQ